MGGLPCAKAAIDGPAILGAEAAAATMRLNGAVAQECAALVQTCKGFAMAFPFIYEALDGLADKGNTAAKTDLLAGLSISYWMCERAKDLALVGHRDHDHDSYPDVAAWRHAVTTWLSSMIEKYMPDEYRTEP